VSAPAGPPLAVVVVTHDSAGHVPTTLRSLDHQLRPDDELVVVDSGSDDGTPDAVRSAAPGATLIECGRNVGFAAGTHVGSRATSAELLLFLNPDADPAPGCLEALRRAAHDRPAWDAWQALVTLPGGARINTSGGIAHYLGIAWAGRCEQPLSAAPDDYEEVGFASGAALVVRREAWDRLGGFDERYFMYGEDLDLALRLRLQGAGVGVAPAAQVTHDYEFAKGSDKWRLLERNRWWTLLGDYPASLLLLLAPALLAFELLLLAVAARGGWLAAKLRAQATVLRELPEILARRRTVQAGATADAPSFARHLSADLDSPHLGALPRPAASLQRAYWRAVVCALEATSRA